MLFTGLDPDFLQQNSKMFSRNLFLLLCFKYSFAVDYSFNKLLVNSSISQAATRIVNDFYVRETSAAVLTAGYVNESNRLRQFDLINEILLRASNSNIKFRLQESRHIRSTYPEEYNVMLIDSYEGFQ